MFCSNHIQNEIVQNQLNVEYKTQKIECFVLCRMTQEQKLNFVISYLFVKCFVLQQLHKEENKNKTFEFEISQVAKNILLYSSYNQNETRTVICLLSTLEYLFCTHLLAERIHTKVFVLSSHPSQRRTTLHQRHLQKILYQAIYVRDVITSQVIHQQGMTPLYEVTYYWRTIRTLYQVIH